MALSLFVVVCGGGGVAVVGLYEEEPRATRRRSELRETPRRYGRLCPIFNPVPDRNNYKEEIRFTFLSSKSHLHFPRGGRK